MAARFVKLADSRLSSLVPKKNSSTISRRWRAISIAFSIREFSYNEGVIVCVKQVQTGEASGIAALKSGRFQHEGRSDINVKNLLATGQVTAEFVEVLVARSNGTQYSASPHYRVASIDVHVIETGGWYVKFYFVSDPDTVYISVHQ